MHGSPIMEYLAQIGTCIHLYVYLVGCHTQVLDPLQVNCRVFWHLNLQVYSTKAVELNLRIGLLLSFMGMTAQRVFALNRFLASAGTCCDQVSTSGILQTHLVQ